jgi:hypothetical protein
MKTRYALEALLERLSCDIEHADEAELDAVDIQDLNDSVESLKELLGSSETWTGDAKTDILHHLFFSGLDSYPRDRLIAWTEELTYYH